MLKTTAGYVLGNVPGSPYEPSYTVDEFCAAERISRVALYDLWKRGKGPSFYMNGRRRIISHSARLEFQQDRMAETGDAVDAAA